MQITRMEGQAILFLSYTPLSNDESVYLTIGVMSRVLLIRQKDSNIMHYGLHTVSLDVIGAVTDLACALINGNDSNLHLSLSIIMIRSPALLSTPNTPTWTLRKPLV